VRKAWFWGAFGTLLVGGILTGFVPDLRLTAERHAALDEGLLEPSAAPVVPGRDAKRAFRQALYENKAAAQRIRLHPESRGWEPNASTVRFVDAAVAASKLPQTDWSGDDPLALPQPTTPIGGIVWNEQPDAYVVSAGEEIAGRAKDESDLMRATRVAGLLDREANLRAAQLWTGLANTILDRAKALHVPPRGLIAALGPPPEVPSLFRRRFSRVVARIERERAAGRMGAWTGKSEEIRYIHVWRDQFRRKPLDATILGKTVEATDPRFEGTPVLFPGPSAPPWSAWANELEKLKTRMAR